MRYWSLPCTILVSFDQSIPLVGIPGVWLNIVLFLCSYKVREASSGKSSYTFLISYFSSSGTTFQNNSLEKFIHVFEIILDFETISKSLRNRKNNKFLDYGRKKENYHHRPDLTISSTLLKFYKPNMFGSCNVPKQRPNEDPCLQAPTTVFDLRVCGWRIGYCARQIQAVGFPG